MELRPKVGQWLFGCDVCQEVCPYNQRPPETPWPEFQPEAGVGHYIDLLSLLEIKDEGEFFKRFQHTALKRPKRRGLLRNCLVVLGNALRTRVTEQRGTISAEEVSQRLVRFCEAESDPLLREHAQWAVAQYAR